MTKKSKMAVKVAVPELTEALVAELNQEQALEEEQSLAVADETWVSEQPEQLKYVIEAILMAAADPMTEEQLLACFLEEAKPTLGQIRQTLSELSDDYAHRGVELKQVASGYRFQVQKQYAVQVSRLWTEKPAKYSRALLETLALIAYRQPITRGEIEDIRGVAVSSSIIKTLEEREWVKVLGHREVPGRPALYATTRAFLDYFNLKSLQELPVLPELMSVSDTALLNESITEIEKPENDHRKEENIKLEDTENDAEAETEIHCEEEITA